MPVCLWSNGTACTAYIWRDGRILPCNGRTPACKGKFLELVETQYRLDKLHIDTPKDAAS